MGAFEDWEKPIKKYSGTPQDQLSGLVESMRVECMLSLMKNGGIPKNKKSILEFMTISFKTSNISLKLLTW